MVTAPVGEATTLCVLRKILLAILILGMAGSGTELILLKHTEEPRQWIPLILLTVASSALAWHVLGGGPTATRMLRWLMIGFIIGGGLGIYFHYRGLVEFKLESNPSLAGWDLFWQAIRGKTPPLLAPGALIQLGLVGLVYTYKHPALSRLKGE
ncbi:MAG TPA: hypothetical protein VK200_04795 [Candidatus Limnocylindrales bacterium]|nr:hypothetical protein [Candidatus Limnocylindrales bacterium]